MAIAEPYSGTETVTTDEWDLPTDTTTLGAITTDGVYQPQLELNNLAKGDLSGSTQRVVYRARFANAQSDPVWVGPSLILIHGWTMSLVKISGTDRAISWSIRSV
jgi:hypothetical protein